MKVALITAELAQEIKHSDYQENIKYNPVEREPGWIISPDEAATLPPEQYKTIDYEPPLYIEEEK